MTTLATHDGRHQQKLCRVEQMLRQWELEDAGLADVIDLRDKVGPATTLLGGSSVAGPLNEART